MPSKGVALGTDLWPVAGVESFLFGVGLAPSMLPFVAEESEGMRVAMPERRFLVAYPYLESPNCSISIIINLNGASYEMIVEK